MSVKLMPVQDGDVEEQFDGIERPRGDARLLQQHQQ